MTLTHTFLLVACCILKVGSVKGFTRQPLPRPGLKHKGFVIRAEEGNGAGGGPDIKQMIKQLEAEGLVVDERITRERVDRDRIEAIVRQEADARFEKATKELQDLAQKMKSQSDEEAKATYEGFKKKLKQREREAEERLKKLETLNEGMEQVQEDALFAKEQVAELEAARQELKSMMGTPQGQLASFKLKPLPKQMALVAAVIGALLAVDSIADLFQALAADDSARLAMSGGRSAVELAIALGGSAFYGVWSGEIIDGTFDE